jgi:hypothetical protein
MPDPYPEVEPHAQGMLEILAAKASLERCFICEEVY